MSNFRILLCYYNAEGMYLLFYVCSLFFLIFDRKERAEKNTRLGFLWYTLLVACLIANPIVIWLIGKFLEHYTEMVRLLYLFPVNFLIAYVAVRLVEKGKTKGKAFLLGIILCVAFVLSGRDAYSLDYFIDTENEYKLPQYAVDIVDAIKEDAGDEGEISIVTPIGDGVKSYIRQYDASMIILERGRRQKDLDNGYDFDKSLKNLEDKYTFDYILTRNDEVLVEGYEKAGYVRLLDAGFYTLFKIQE